MLALALSTGKKVIARPATGLALTGPPAADALSSVYTRFISPGKLQRGTGSTWQAVERYVRPFRAMTAAPPPGPVVPSTRQITRWLLSRPAARDDDDQAQLASLQDRCPDLDALAGHMRSFAEMMSQRRGQQELEGWLTAVEADDQPKLRSFAHGIRRDQPAVTAGLTLPYSSAAVEATSAGSRCHGT